MNRGCRTSYYQATQVEASNCIACSGTVANCRRYTCTSAADGVCTSCNTGFTLNATTIE
eukprot:Awhi_evm2s6254